MQKIAQPIQLHRLDRNLTQRQLAERSGVAYSTLRKLESTGTGSITDYVKLLKALQMNSHLAALGCDEEQASAPPIRRRARTRSSTPIEFESINPIAAAPLTTTNRLKSSRLGLSFPYDWSNPQIADEVLIAKVLDKARFDDVSRTTAHYGLPLVEQVAQRFGIDLGAGPLGAILPSIRLAQVAA
jgi:transcriptional regulator with XRE-family HTH domain